MFAVLLLADAADAALAAYRARTAAVHRCVVDRTSTDITVCGLRSADRFRVPFVVPDPGDPRNEAVSVERLRLTAPYDHCREKSAFLVGCGKVGVSLSTRTGLTGANERPIAP